MYFQQSDLLRGLNEDFVKEFMDIGQKETYEAGHILFREGDSAQYFFALLQGRVKITTGETGHTVFSAAHPGDVFGWSSLVERDKYTASAECSDKTTLLRIDVERLNRLLEKDAVTGMIFFKRLAGVLGNRLLQTYKFLPLTADRDTASSFGTGQMLKAETTVL